MKASSEEQTGGIGESEVAGNLQRIGWGPVIPNKPHDLGIDLFVQARDARLFDLGLFVALQVKSGTSYFGEPAHDEEGVTVGWWYRQPDANHFDDWVTHGLPHLLVLHDLETRDSYWVHVTASSVQSTGKGTKILVPVINKIDSEHLENLLEVAATHKSVISFEGSAWITEGRTIGPARLLRHALLVPRLVAPHRNSGFVKPIGPEEGLALLSAGRIDDYASFAERHETVPDLVEAASSTDWVWRFVAAFGAFVSEDDGAGLARAITDAPNWQSKTAACVVTACSLMDEERHEEAIALLGSVGEVGPVDLAWLLTQRARARSEIGEVAAAREDAVAAQRSLVGDSNDVTASAIKAAASWLLFETAAWGDKQLGEAIAAADTTVSWWRNQTLSSGLADAANRAFRQWTDDQATRFGWEDTVNNRLFAALMNAHLVGEQGAWRATSSLLARNSVVVKHGASKAVGTWIAGRDRSIWLNERIGGTGFR